MLIYLKIFIYIQITLTFCMCLLQYRRGFVPKYVHFVKPVSLNSRSSSDPRIQTSDYEEFFDEIEDGGMYGNVLSDLSLMEADQDELVQTELYEDWLELPDSPSEPVGDWESQG